MKRFILLSCLALSSVFYTQEAFAFCGFYVAKADTKLFNNASKVVIAKDGDRTVITMANDYEGDAKDFAMVVPVPVKLEKEQIHITENKIIDHLDAYTAPRLVEYFDSDPCHPMILMEATTMDAIAPQSAPVMKRNKSAKNLGVKIEAEYTVEEYDILILSAKESEGLQTWLDQQGYKVPKKARDVLGSYIKQGVKFFVAKVNLKEHEKRGGGKYLRPISIAFDSPKFMLPIRLGTVNAKGTQELFIFTLTKKGRVETTNYRTTKIPTGQNLPVYIKGEFDKFYPAMFDEAVKKEGMKTVFLEYAWDMSWCDPCAADPLSKKQLKELGVSWLGDGTIPPSPPVISPVPLGQPVPAPRPLMIMPPQGQNVFVTRLHVRYDAKNFPEDLKFQETSDRQNFQGRYVLQHPFKGEMSCDAGFQYKKSLVQRHDNEAKELAKLTGWDINEIRKTMKEKGVSFEKPKPSERDKNWWKKLWQDE